MRSRTRWPRCAARSKSLEKVEEPKLRRQLSSIAAHDVQRLDRLVTEIADASRIDAELSRTIFEPVDMVALVKSLAEARRQRGVNRDCELKVSRSGDGPWLVPGDASKLERVLENLFDNAVSFSPPGGVIAVALSRDADRLRIDVSDQGPGIPSEAREEVFERFHSLRPDSEDFGNHSGLGLAIARTIVEAHDGTLLARDRDGGAPGACLTIDLPAWEAE